MAISCTSSYFAASLTTRIVTLSHIGLWNNVMVKIKRHLHGHTHTHCSVLSRNLIWGGGGNWRYGGGGGGGGGQRVHEKGVREH